MQDKTYEEFSPVQTLDSKSIPDHSNVQENSGCDLPLSNTPNHQRHLLFTSTPDSAKNPCSRDVIAPTDISISQTDAPRGITFIEVVKKSTRKRLAKFETWKAFILKKA